MRIDYKGGQVKWDLINEIDWTKIVSFETEGYLSQDMLTIEYTNCLIDLGWYGGPGGHFTIMVIVPSEKGKEYTAEDWSHPYALIPCENQYDMLLQLQRAIDIYPQIL